MTAKKRLGRGLDALLSQENGGHEPAALDSAGQTHLPLDKIDPNPFQPRQIFEENELIALADSIKQHGVIQPILVRAQGDRYQLIAGERRLRACLIAMIHEIPARVLQIDDRRVAEIAIIENLQREDLSPLEKGVAFNNYLKAYNCRQEELAGRLGIDRTTISNMIRLLELPQPIQDALQNKQITQGHARALLQEPVAEKQIAYCQRVTEENLSVRQTETLVATGDFGAPKGRPRKDELEYPFPYSFQPQTQTEAEAQAQAQAPLQHQAPPQFQPSPQYQPPPSPRPQPQHQPDIEPEFDNRPSIDSRPRHFQELESHLKDRFGTPVIIKSRSQERGQIVIPFNTLEEFERVSALIRAF